MNPQLDPLSELRGLALPDPISWWPLAPGWWLLLLLLIVSFGALGLLYKKRHTDSWRLQAKREFAAIREVVQSGRYSQIDVLRRCSALFRRVAMALEPRKNIAGLTGQKWLEKLDALSASREFTQGAGSCLGDEVWKKPHSVQVQRIESVLNLLEKFINQAANDNTPPSRKRRGL